ncbi:hypothetical protein EON81_24470 [bacterium]|nr:MAG: hypothetical protein EON81_24470 [bacterium]
MKPTTLAVTLAATLLMGAMLSGCGNSTVGGGDPMKGATPGPQPSSQGSLPAPGGKTTNTASGSGNSFGR